MTPDKTKNLQELITLFKNNIKQYKSNSYDEAKTRLEFIDKFFELLDWDVRNIQGFSEQYKEVIVEDKVLIEGKQKAPDYSFRIGGTRKFFVEAKKPSINIKEDIIPAFQIRRYAYTAKLPLSILTDFEEIAIYDTRIKPDKNDKASNARVFYCIYEDLLKPSPLTEYDTNFDFIYNTFSKDAILKGSFDKYIQENKNKKGTSEVDKEFLKLIETWRSDLARNIALRNSDVNIYNLNYAIQKIIDRFIFLRIAEDRQMEKYGLLQNACKESEIYKSLNEIFLKSHKKYNSGLFVIEDWLCNLSIDDKVLSSIIKELYYPECPYEFSVLPIEILGNIYEQFLGKTIRLTPSHQAKVEDKPEIRKAGGVHYTPRYIVIYIVENTVGEKIKGKSPEQIAKIKILDPACGSGSFLVGTYEYLLKYHLDYYIDQKHIKSALKSGKIYHISENTYYLSIEEKQSILLNNIYGVDIDNQAVEVTKLSLLLKLMEGENIESQGQLFKYSDHKLLPDLSNNIKCGNSLIGSDFYKNKDLSLFEDEEMRKINVFDWEKEFKEIFDNGGFDVVIGNPPYVLIGSDKTDEQNYYIKYFELINYKINTYVLFLEKGGKILNENGILGFITPKSLVFNTFFSETRNKLLMHYKIPKIVEIKEKVFDNAEVGDSILFFMINEINTKNNKLIYSIVKNVYPTFQIINQFKNIQSILLEDNDKRFYIDDIKIKAKTKLLNELFIVSNGLNPGNIKDILLSEKKETENHQKLILGRDIQKYNISWSGTWVNYDPELKKTIKLSDTKSKKGMTAQQKVDFALRKPEIYTPNKIMIRKTADHLIAAFDDFGYYFDSLSYGIQKLDSTMESRHYILALLNSSLLNNIHNGIAHNKDKVFAKVLATNIKKLPIKTIDFSNISEKSQHDKLVSLVDQMLETQKQFHSAKSDNDKKLYQQKINLIDKQIDRLVYELYGLTDEEIKIIEK